MGHGEPGEQGGGLGELPIKALPESRSRMQRELWLCEPGAPLRAPRAPLAPPRSSALCLPAAFLFYPAAPVPVDFKCICSSGDNPCKSEALAASARFTKRTQLQEVTRSQLLLPLYFSLIAELLHVYSD